VPLSFKDFQRLVIGVLILLGLAPAAGFGLYRLVTGPRGVAWLGLGLLAVSMTVYPRWWYQPVAFVHAMPLPAAENIALWLVTGCVAYGLAALTEGLVRRGKGFRLFTACAAYALALGCATTAVLAPLATMHWLPAPRAISGRYGVAWEKPFALPSYSLSEWVLEADPETGAEGVAGSASGRGRLYVVAGTDAVRLDLATGTEDWRTPLGLTGGQVSAANSNLTLLVAGDSLYVIRHSDDGRVLRLDKESGAIQWATESPLRLSGSGTAEDVQFTAQEILLLPALHEPAPLFYYAVETGTGSVTAVDNLLPEGHVVAFGHTSSPYAWVRGEAGTLALHVFAYPPGFSPEMVWQENWSWSDAGWLVGISAETGRPEWRVQGVGGRDPYAPPAVAIDPAGWLTQTVPRAGTAPEYVYRSLPDGRERWRAASTEAYGTAWLLPDLVMVGEYGERITVRALRRDSGQESWRREIQGGYAEFVRPVLVTDELIALDCGNHVAVVRRDDGTTVWERKMPEPGGPADRVSIGAVYPGAGGPVLVLREQLGGLRSGRAVAVSLETGEDVSLAELEDTYGFEADGYLLRYAGGEDGRPWHPALGGGRELIKLQGEAVRTRVRYAGPPGSLTPEWWGKELVFPLAPEAPWGSLGPAPYTGAYEVEMDAVMRSFGGQMLVLVRGEDARCWIVALVGGR
jgi:outer membrane protein assembly factor BamB